MAALTQSPNRQIKFAAKFSGYTVVKEVNWERERKYDMQLANLNHSVKYTQVNKKIVAKVSPLG